MATPAGIASALGTLACIAVACCLAGVHLLPDTLSAEPANWCRMTYMWPSLEEVDDPRLANTRGYTLHRYTEQRAPHHKVTDILLFVHGQGGGFRQARSIGSVLSKTSPGFAVYTVDFNEELPALETRLLLDESSFLEKAIAVTTAAHNLHEVDIVAHSMGALATLLLPQGTGTPLRTFIALSSPINSPPVLRTPHSDTIYALAQAGLLARLYTSFRREEGSIGGEDPAAAAAAAALPPFRFYSVSGGVREALIPRSAAWVHCPSLLGSSAAAVVGGGGGGGGGGVGAATLSLPSWVQGLASPPAAVRFGNRTVGSARGALEAAAPELVELLGVGGSGGVAGFAEFLSDGAGCTHRESYALEGGASCDHQAVVWCNQVVVAAANTLAENAGASRGRKKKKKKKKAKKAKQGGQPSLGSPHGLPHPEGSEAAAVHSFTGFENDVFEVRVGLAGLEGTAPSAAEFAKRCRPTAVCRTAAGGQMGGHGASGTAPTAVPLWDRIDPYAGDPRRQGRSPPPAAAGSAQQHAFALQLTAGRQGLADRGGGGVRGWAAWGQAAVSGSPVAGEVRCDVVVVPAGAGAGEGEFCRAASERVSVTAGRAAAHSLWSRFFEASGLPAVLHAAAALAAFASAVGPLVRCAGAASLAALLAVACLAGPADLPAVALARAALLVAQILSAAAPLLSFAALPCMAFAAGMS